MQKNTNIDKKIPVTIRVTGYIQDIKVLNSGALSIFKGLTIESLTLNILPGGKKRLK